MQQECEKLLLTIDPVHFHLQYINLICTCNSIQNSNQYIYLLQILLQPILNVFYTQSYQEFVAHFCLLKEIQDCKR